MLLILSCSVEEKNLELIKNPNILLIIADDMGLDATPGYNVGSIKPHMPNLESFINSGISDNIDFTNSVYLNYEIKNDTIISKNLVLNRVNFKVYEGVEIKLQNNSKIIIKDLKIKLKLSKFSNFAKGLEYLKRYNFKKI